MKVNGRYRDSHLEQIDIFNCYRIVWNESVPLRFTRWVGRMLSNFISRDDIVKLNTNHITQGQPKKTNKQTISLPTKENTVKLGKSWFGSSMFLLEITEDKVVL